MEFEGFSEPLLILMVGVLAVASRLLASRFRVVGLPPLVGFLLLGFVLRLADSRLSVLSAAGLRVFDTLAKIGVICLLFRIGLESDLGALLRQLRPASLIWGASLLVNGATGFAVSYWLLGVGLIPGIFVAAALTATSVGVAVGVWQEAGRLGTRSGDLLIDAAEMNDISGVVILALLFGVAPLLHGQDRQLPLARIAGTLGLVVVKLGGFGLLCWLFSRYVERRYTAFCQRVEGDRPSLMVTVAGTAFVLAAVAGILGFSVAIGAFFAGLVFSRDPKAVRLEASFDSIYDLFVPFFFIGIGLSLDPAALVESLRMGAILAAVAFGAMVLVSLATCLAVPVVLQRLFRRWPPEKASVGARRGAGGPGGRG